MTNLSSVIFSQYRVTHTHIKYTILVFIITELADVILDHVILYFTENLIFFFQISINCHEILHTLF